jgi:hypothetical protein
MNSPEAFERAYMYAHNILLRMKHDTWLSICGRFLPDVFCSAWKSYVEWALKHSKNINRKNN